MTTLSSDPQFVPETKSVRGTQVNKGFGVPVKLTFSTTDAQYEDIEDCTDIILTFLIGGTGTYTIHLTTQNDGTDGSSCTYPSGFSQYGVECLTGAAAASYTADGVYKIKSPGKFLKIAFSAITGTNYVHIEKRYL